MTKQRVMVNAYTKQMLDTEDETTEANPDGSPSPAMQADGATDTEAPSSTDSPEIQKTRYDHLKKRYDQVVPELRTANSELTERINALEEKLLSKDRNTLPTGVTKEEVESWIKQNPTAYTILGEVVQQTANAEVAGLKAQVKDLREDSASSSVERSIARAKELIPDFDEVTASAEFHNWVASKNEATQAMVFDNPDKPEQLKLVVDAFRQESGWGTSSPTTSAIDASRDVSSSGSGSTLSQGAQEKKVWKASEIKALLPKDYAKFEDEIDAAHAEGRIDQFN